MARYCFYCGRELDDYEKCRCRERSRVSGEGYDDTAATPPPSRTDRASDSRRTQTKQATSDPNTSYAWKHQEEPASSKTKTKKRTTSSRDKYKRSPADRAKQAQKFGSFLTFFAAPADSMQRDLSPDWSTSHSLWFSLTIALAGIHYMMLNRSLTAIITGQTAKLSTGAMLLSWLTGTGLVALILLLYALTLWLLARFLFRQGRLPLLHALSAGKIAWKYLTLFLLLSLPSLFTGGAIYGLTLALMGLVFAVIVHARQVASLTYLNDNKTWQLAYLSIIFFAGIFSAVTSFARILNIMK